MRAFERHPSYKNSSVEWIGDIPSHWEMKKIKYVASINPSVNIKLDDDTKLEFVPMENIDEKNGLIREYSYRPYEEIKTGYTPFQNNDVIFAKITPCMENGNCAIAENLSKNLAFGSTEFIVLRSNEQIQKGLLYYFLRDKNTRKIFEINMTGSAGQKRVPTQFVANFKILLPPIEEQKQIADFLDTKSKQIDEFIADKQALIALFEEQKSAIINEAVTKGLDKTAPLKPSGIEWIDKIPSHWLMRKVSQSFSTIGSGTTPSSGNEAYYKDGHILWINSGDLNNGYLDDSEKKVNQNALNDFSALKMYKEGSLIVAMYGATIGKLAILQGEACVNQACCVLNDSEYFEIKFVFYWFLANKQNIVNLSFGGGQPNISQDVIKNLKIQAPSIKEQKQIVSYLETELSKIDTLIETAKAEITLIEEYKTSLINEVVTGKIKI